MKKVLITGGTGFIGRNLALYLRNSNRHVVVMSRRKPDERIDGIEYIQTDITDYESIKHFFKECETVYHGAALISFQKKDFTAAFNVNVKGTENVLKCATENNIKKVVHLSAGAVLGFSNCSDIVIDETARPTIKKDNVYAYTKHKAEQLVQKFVKTHGTDVSIANIATVYGQGDTSLNSGAIIKAIYLNQIRFLPPGGTSFVDIDDLVQGLVLLEKNGRPGQRYIFVNQNMTYKQLAQKIAHVLEQKIRFVVIPKITGHIMIPVIYGLSGLLDKFNLPANIINPQILKESFNYKYFSGKKAMVELGWHPCEKFETSVEKALHYYRDKKIL